MKLSQAEKDIVSRIDHTCLSPTAGREDIRRVCEEALCAGAASVCIPPYYVLQASALLSEHDNAPKICTVIGFPNGYSSTSVKCAEIVDAVNNGAEEVDIVANIGAIKEANWEEVKYPLLRLRSVCESMFVQVPVMKLIVETAYLTPEEIRKMCEICIQCHIDYIKTSTGFASRGASLRDIQIMKDAIGGRNLKIKAAGGIATLEQAKAFIEAGADRIGSSKIIPQLIKTKGRN